MARLVGAQDVGRLAVVVGGAHLRVQRPLLGFEGVDLFRQGFDVALDAWRGIAAPKGTPAPVIAALERAIKATTESEEFAKGSANLAVRPGFLPAKEFGELIAKDDAAIARLMQEIGLKK